MSNFTNGSEMPQEKPKDYLVLSILVTLFCCLPFGIVSIVKSSKTNQNWSEGNYAEARKCSKDAKTWIIVSAICGGVIYLMYIIYFCFLFFAPQC